VIGDGALTGGMAWEALNNIAASERPMVIVVNDNARSYSPTIGGMAHHLAVLRTTRGYEQVMGWGKRVLHRTPVVGNTIYGALHGMKKGVKDIMAPQGLFEDLGLKYIGPVDGHDEASPMNWFPLHVNAMRSLPSRLPCSAPQDWIVSPASSRTARSMSASLSSMQRRARQVWHLQGSILLWRYMRRSSIVPSIRC